MPNKAAFIIFDNYLTCEIPGVAANTPWASFPIWGCYQFFDIFLIMLKEIKKSLFDFYILPLPQNEIFYQNKIKIYNLQSEINLLASAPLDFINWFKNNKYENYFIWQPSRLAFFPFKDLDSYSNKKIKDIYFFLLNNKKFELYLIPRKELQNILQSIDLNPEKLSLPTEQLTTWMTTIFQDKLAKLANIPIELEGKGILLNSPQDYYLEHLVFLQNILTPDGLSKLKSILAFLKPSANTEALLTEESEVINSYISPGATVSGKVVNSVIFSDVLVEKGSQIIDSVIMNGNRLGKMSVIKNTLVFPYLKKQQQNIYNIGHTAQIGSQDKTSKNKTYPRLIRNGLTVLGMNSELPDGIKIGSAVFLGADLPKTKLISYNKIESSECLENL